MKVGKLVLFRKRVASHTPLGTKHVCAVLRSGGGGLCLSSFFDPDGAFESGPLSNSSLEDKNTRMSRWVGRDTETLFNYGQDT